MARLSCVLLLVVSFALVALSPTFAQSEECRLTTEKQLTEKQQQRFQQLLDSGADKAAIRYNLALGYGRLGNQQKALAALQQALADTPWLDPAEDPGFTFLHGCDQFQKLVKRVESKYPPRAAGQVAFTVAQKDLIPEGLAVDPRDGSLYMSSIYHRKIVKISAKGDVSDFVSEAQDGLLGVLGIKVDPVDRSVWAASEREDASALFHFDRNGHTLGKYAPQEAGKHLFNDLVVTPSRDVYVTDSDDGSLYKLAHGSQQLSRIDLRASYPNGIALGGDGNTLYVAHSFGILRMEIGSGAFAELPAPKDISTAQADGLYYRQGRLIAIQNGLGANRIVELQLTKDGRSVVAGRLLEFRSPTLELPTTGAIYGRKFYYIVNSQIDHEDHGKLNNPDQLKPVKIAVLQLTR